MKNLDPVLMTPVAASCFCLGLVLIWLTAPLVVLLRAMAMCLGSLAGHLQAGWRLGRGLK